MARLAANEEALKLREQAEKAFGTRRRELTDLEQRLSERESLINRQLEGLVQREKDLRDKQQELEEKKTSVEAERNELIWLAKLRKEQLQKLSHLSEAEARARTDHLRVRQLRLRRGARRCLGGVRRSDIRLPVADTQWQARSLPRATSKIRDPLPIQFACGIHPKSAPACRLKLISCNIGSAYPERSHDQFPREAS